MSPRTKSNKTTKTKSLNKKAIGKASVEKGRKFEDKVADLYRLLDAEVTQNIEIHGKKIDILAEFRLPGSHAIHKVIVECKDEVKVVDANNRVMAFNGLLRTCRVDGAADSGEIITRVPWSDQAKGFAKESNINLVTYHQKVSQLLNFRPYLKDLINRFENGDIARPSEPALGKYYVDLSAAVIERESEQKIPVISSYISEWLDSTIQTKQLAIFGEYGAGKSTLSQKTAYDLAFAYRDNPDGNRIPIILNLRDFIGKLKIEAFITSFLDSECNVNNPRYRLFQTMNAAGIFLLIFDGLDEMAVKVDSDTLESNLMEIEKLAATPNAKVILTSRPEHFVNIEEEQQFLSPQSGLFNARETAYQPLKILPWDDKQIDTFLERRVPLVKEAKSDWKYYRDKIRDISDLKDLSKRPVLLDMIVKTLPRMIKSNIEINLTNLYKTYIVGEIKRQRISKKREFLLTEKVRMGILEKVSTNTYFNVMESINFKSVLEIVRQYTNPPEAEVEAYTRDFLTNSFLIRKGDQYVFSHKSIFEYLIAKILCEEIARNSTDLFGRFRFGTLPITFLREFDCNKTTLLDWILSSGERQQPENLYLGGNAATLLTRLDPSALAGKQLSGTNLTGAVLNGADLRGTSLRGANLKDVRLIRARFDQHDIRGAKLSNTLVGFYYDGRGDRSIATTIFQTLPPNILKKYNVRIAFQSPLLKHKGKARRNQRLMHIQIPENECIDEVRGELASHLPSKLSVYDNELE